MALPKTIIGCLLPVSLFVAACSDNVTAPVVTVAPTAAVNQPGDDSTSPLPATNTPVSPSTSPAITLESPGSAPTAAPVGTSTALPAPDAEELEAIDAVLQEIDDDLCREAHEARVEVETLLAQGEDVADLEAAIVELIEELENCSLEITPDP